MCLVDLRGVIRSGWVQVLPNLDTYASRFGPKFCSMPNPKFLDFDKTFNDDEVGTKLQFPCRIELLPYKLRILRWKECPLKSLPATFKAEHLVEMIMPGSNLTKFWDGEQVIEFYSSLRRKYYLYTCWIILLLISTTRKY